KRTSFTHTRTVPCLVITFFVWIYVIVSPAIDNNFHLARGMCCANVLANAANTNIRIRPVRFTIEFCSGSGLPLQEIRLSSWERSGSLALTFTDADSLDCAIELRSSRASDQPQLGV